VPILIAQLRTAFASKRNFRDFPIFGILVKALGCLFISRGASADKRDQIVEQIGERQQTVELTGKYPPICIFPEGGTSNGHYILPLKRGAFASLRAVKPIILKYSYGTVSPAWDVAPFMPLVIMMLSLFDFKCEVIELPTFIPNDYLFSNHADKGKEKHEIYAWAVREVMSAAGDMDKSEAAFREKLYYEKILGFRKDVPVIKQEREPLLNDQEEQEGKYGAN
jgi:1-acyl-sn-glycerol-3-phosphate acyltransferase